MRNECIACFQRGLGVTHEMEKNVIAGLRRCGMEVIVAPYEADPQLAYLCHIGYCDGVMTEDSDILVYSAVCGTPFPILYKFDKSGAVQTTDLKLCGIFGGSPPPQSSASTSLNAMNQNTANNVGVNNKSKTKNNKNSSSALSRGGSTNLEELLMEDHIVEEEEEVEVDENSSSSNSSSELDAAVGVAGGFGKKGNGKGNVRINKRSNSGSSTTTTAAPPTSGSAGFVQQLQTHFQNHNSAMSNNTPSSSTNNSAQGRRMFVQLCLLAGCDYSDSIPSVGIQTAMQVK